MKSDRLTLSNRANALKSTGPRSAAGKDASSMNRMTTGMYANKLIILGEDPADFEQLTQEHYQFHLPVTPDERFQLDAMIRCEWQLRRLDAVEAQVWAHRVQQSISTTNTSVDLALGKAYYNADTVFARLERQKAMVYRTYKEASAELAALQAARYEVEQAAKAEAEAAEIPQVPVPQPIAAEVTYLQNGFVPSTQPEAPAHPIPAAPAALQIGFVPSVAPVVDFSHRCLSEEPATGPIPVAL